MPSSFLLASAILQIAGVVALKASRAGGGRPGLAGPILIGASLIPLAFAMRALPIAPTMAVWAASGAVAASLAGAVLLGEPARPLSLASAGMIILGCVGLAAA